MNFRDMSFKELEDKKDAYAAEHSLKEALRYNLSNSIATYRLRS